MHTYEVYGGILDLAYIDTITREELENLLQRIVDPELVKPETILEQLDTAGEYEGIVAYYAHKQGEPGHEPDWTPISEVVGYLILDYGYPSYLDESDGTEYLPYRLSISVAR